jgi:hypothetical protein
MINKIKWFIQKTFRGYSERDLWSLDYHLSKLIATRLRAFKEINTHSFATGFKSVKDWHKTIDKMIWALENWNEDGYCFTHYGPMKFGEPNERGNVPLIDIGCKMNEKKFKKHCEKVNEGMDLLRKYFFDLWD